MVFGNHGTMKTRGRVSVSILLAALESHSFIAFKYSPSITLRHSFSCSRQKTPFIRLRRKPKRAVRLLPWTCVRLRLLWLSQSKLKQRPVGKLTLSDHWVNQGALRSPPLAPLKLRIPLVLTQKRSQEHSPVLYLDSVDAVKLLIQFPELMNLTQ